MQYIRKTARYNGKKYEATGKTELEAMTKLAEKLAAAKRGEEVIGGAMTVDAWYKAWKATYKDPKGLTAKSLGMYDEKYKGYIKPAIGHMKLIDIRPQHLNTFYKNLAEPGVRMDEGRATAKIDMRAWMKENKKSRASIGEAAGVAASTVSAAVSGKSIQEVKAKAIAEAMGKKLGDVFTVVENTEPLSEKTILAHHRLLSMILAQAEKEMLVPYNAAAKATPPKAEKTPPTTSSRKPFPKS